MLTPKAFSYFCEVSISEYRCLPMTIIFSHVFVSSLGSRFNPKLNTKQRRSNKLLLESLYKTLAVSGFQDFYLILFLPIFGIF